MPFEYVNNLDAVINVLKNNNTITSAVDLSANLPTRINNDDINDTDPEMEKPRSDRLPAIFVLIPTADEEFSGIGATGSTKNKKDKTVTYDIFGIMGKSGAHSSHRSLLRDSYNMARNIEGVFQTEFKLSNTALVCNPASTQFSPVLDIGDSFARAFLITLEAQYNFR